MDLMDIEDLVPEEFGGVCGIIAPIIAYLSIGIAILVNRSWFSWSDNPLSHLGGSDATYGNIFNVGLVLAGIVGFLFAMAIFRLIETRVGIGGVSSFMAGMIFLLLVGIFPRGSGPHQYVAIAFFIFSFLGMILIAIDQLLDWSEPIWGVFIISALIFAGCVAMLVYSMVDSFEVATIQFIGTIPMMHFTLVWGARLLFE